MLAVPCQRSRSSTFTSHPPRLGLSVSQASVSASPPLLTDISVVTMWARTRAQCHFVFAKLGIRHNWRADPLVRAGRPRPAFLSKNQTLATIDKPARGLAADEGVRPTIYAGGGIGKTNLAVNRCWPEEFRVVEYVERLQPELQRLCLAQPDAFRQ